MAENVGIQDYRDRHTKVKFGVWIAWFLNALILTLTVESAIVLTLLTNKSTTEEVVSVVLSSFPISAVVALVAVWLVSLFAWKAVRLNAQANMMKVAEGSVVYNVVEEMMVASGTPPKKRPDVYIAESNVKNAYALSTPYGSQIVFTSALVNVLNREELQAVAAHEWGHVLAGDSKAMTKLIAMASIGGIVSQLFTSFIPSSNNKDNRETNWIAVAVQVIAFLFLLIAPLVAQLANLFMSRNRESQADVYSVKLTRNPTALARALQKISHNPGEDKKLTNAVGQLAFFGKDSFLTHPPLDKRLRALQAMGAHIE